MAWQAIAAIIASKLLENYNQNRTARKQDEAALEGLRRQRGFEDQARQRFNQQLQELEQSTPDDERKTLASQIRQQLRAKQALALSGIQPTGGSDAVTMYAGDAGPIATDYGDFIGNTMASLDAPLYQRRGEAYDRADTGNLIRTMSRNASTEDMLTRMRIAGIRPNPWLTMAAQALGAYGTSGATMFNPQGAQSYPTVNPYISASSAAPGLPWMTPDYSAYFGQPGKYGIFKQRGMFQMPGST